MQRRQRLAALVAGAATTAAAVIGAGLVLAPGAGAQDAAAPLQGESLWTNPDTQAAEWAAENADDPRAGLIDERIAQTPAGTWFTQHNPGEITGQVAAVTQAAAATGAAPILVVYNIPNRDCGGHSGGGAPDHQSYRAWVDDFAAGLSGPAYIVLEPDTLPHECADDGERQQINASLAHAAQAIKAASAQSRVYIDIGHSDWLAPATAAQRLQDAGLAHADGFALNTSNYRTTEESTDYARQIQSIVGADKGAVIDTSRNGNGPLGEEWCDPAGRALGDRPTTATGAAGIDAYLWVKLPGEADGCAGAAGQFIPDLAYAMAEAADWPGAGPAEGCAAEIVVVATWNGGWQAEVRVTAGAGAIDGWTLTWDWPADQSVTSSWNVALNQSGTTVTAGDVGWNGSIAAAETRTAFGFIGSGTSTAPEIACAA